MFLSYSSSKWTSSKRMLWRIPLILFWATALATSYAPPVSRREAFQTSLIAGGSTGLLHPTTSWAATGDDESRLDLSMETGKTYSIPYIGYSLYKTDAEQVPLCVEVALQAGVQHFDVGSQYGTNQEVGKALKTYLVKGMEGSPVTKLERRQQLFVSHKISNEEQSTQIRAVKKSVKKQLQNLQLDYLDLCSVHSPLTDSCRLATYNALLDLQKEGIVRAVGVCNYGVNPLEEIVHAGLPAPAVNQLVLSPFNQHKDVVEWIQNNQQRTVLSCGAWSRLSSAQGPQEGWAILADIGKAKGLTKAQVLVRWAFQKGYLCVPRSGSKYKIERIAIQENSYNGVKDVALSEKEMALLDGLDEQFPVGRLGITDGWSIDDITSETWDPTLAV